MVLPTALLAKRSVAYPNTDVPFSESEDRGTFPCPWLELSDRQHGYGCSGDDRHGKTRHEKIKRLMSEVLLCGGDPLSRSQRRCETERSCVRCGQDEYLRVPFADVGLAKRGQAT